MEEKTEDVCVTAIESPTSFWAQVADQESAIEKLNADLQLFCKNKPLLQTYPIINKIYGGVYADDKMWYRCKIKEMHQDQVKVHFIDYGNTEMISQRSLVFLSTDLLSPGPFAGRYCLKGYSPPKDKPELFDKGLQYLSELLCSDIVSIKHCARRISPETPCPVEVIHSPIGDVGKEMEKKGFVFVSTHSSPAPSPLATPSRRSPPVTPVSPKTFFPDNEKITHLTKENLMLRESIKGMEQLVKNMEEQNRKERKNSVTIKFQKLINQGTQLGSLRKSHFVEDKAAVIDTAIDLFKADHTKKQLSRDKLDKAESHLSACQHSIKACVDKDVLSELVSQRNKAQQNILEAIDQFLSQVETLPLDSRIVDLQVTLGRLTVHSSSGGPIAGLTFTATEAIEAYRGWMERSVQALAEMQSNTKETRVELCSELGKIVQILSDPECDPDIADMDIKIESHLTAMKEEAQKIKAAVNSEGDAIRGQVVTALIGELSAEMEEISELRDKLLPHYKALKEELQSHMSCDLDVSKVSAVRKSVKSLRSKIRHKLADQRDLEESEDPEDVEALKEVETALSELYLQLHQSYLEEHQQLEILARMAVNKPELPLLFPELGLTQFMATSGLVKIGWEVDHFPNCGDQAWTVFNGEPCLLKKCKFDEGGVSRLEFEARAIRYSKISHPRLAKIQALFYDKSKRRAFLQTPYVQSLEEWLESFPEAKELAVVSEDIAEAVNALHSHGITHGNVNEETVRVTQSDGVTRAVLTNPDFSKPREEDEKDGNTGSPLVSQDLDAVTSLRVALDLHAKARPKTPVATEQTFELPDVASPTEEKSAVPNKEGSQVPDASPKKPDVDSAQETADKMKSPKAGAPFSDMPALQPILEEKQNSPCPRQN